MLVFRDKQKLCIQKKEYLKIGLFESSFNPCYQPARLETLKLDPYNFAERLGIAYSNALNPSI